MVARIDSRGLTLIRQLAKWPWRKKAPGKFDIRMQKPRPLVADLTNARIPIIPDGPGAIRVEKEAEEPPIGEICWRNLV